MRLEAYSGEAEVLAAAVAHTASRWGWSEVAHLLGMPDNPTGWIRYRWPLRDLAGEYFEFLFELALGVIDSLPALTGSRENERYDWAQIAGVAIFNAFDLARVIEHIHLWNGVMELVYQEWIAEGTKV